MNGVAVAAIEKTRMISHTAAVSLRIALGFPRIVPSRKFNITREQRQNTIQRIKKMIV